MNKQNGGYWAAIFILHRACIRRVSGHSFGLPIGKKMISRLPDNQFSLLEACLSRLALIRKHIRSNKMPNQNLAIDFLFDPA